MKDPRMRRHKFKAVADDDSLPVIVPRNDKVAVPISRERVRRLRKHLIVTLRALRMTKDPEHSVLPLRPEPEGFTARVARAACSLCKGWCCTNGGESCLSGSSNDCACTPRKVAAECTRRAAAISRESARGRVRGFVHFSRKTRLYAGPVSAVRPGPR